MGYPQKPYKQWKSFIPKKEEKKKERLEAEQMIVDGVAVWKIKKKKKTLYIPKELIYTEIIDLWSMREMKSMPSFTHAQLRTSLTTTGTLKIVTGRGGLGYFDGDDFPEPDEFKPIEETEESKQIKEKAMQLKEVLRNKFINVDEVADILEIGHVTKKNVFLYGRGGHAKSEIIQEFLKHVDPEGNDSFVQACGEGLTEEKLFGGLNLAKFQKTGEIEYLVENSFMNRKYVVFEELLDSRMNVLLSLKDILTSGMFRQGSQQFKIKTEFVICLTNRTKQEVAEDNSIKALMERFPLEMKVEWDKYEANDYIAMFSKVLKNPLNEVAGICQAINESGDFVSPRTAIHMAQVYLTTRNISNLKYFGATREIIEKMQKLEKERQESDRIKAAASTYVNYVTSVSPVTMDDFKKVKKGVKDKLIHLNSFTYSDKNYGEYTALRTAMETKIKEYHEQMLKLIEND